MSSCGWIKIHRKILENPIFSNAELFQLYMYCLLRANHSDKEVFSGEDIIQVKAGQFITGRKKLSLALNVNETTIYKRLKKLEKLKFLELKSNNKNTLVTIVNWDFYQAINTEGEQQSDNKVTTKEQQSDTNKNDKNEKNDNNKNIGHQDDLKTFFETIWALYPNKKGKAGVSMRQIKKLHSLGVDTISKCVDRYKRTKEGWKEYQQGSTFFNKGYIDYLDENFKEIGNPAEIPSYWREM